MLCIYIHQYIFYTSIHCFSLMSYCIKYILLQWTYHGYLNLEFATCQDVNISFRAVTRYNTSDYSPVLNICIDGGIYV